MTIFKCISIRLTISFRLRTGTVKEIKKNWTEEQSKKVFAQFLQDFLRDLKKKKRKGFISMTHDLL